MALDNYTDLQAAVADWLNRTDLTAVIPDAITLCEAEVRRRLRRTSVSDTIDIDGEVMDLPSDLAELRSLSLNSGQPFLDGPLRECTPEMLAERKARNGGALGRPTDFAIIAGQLQVAPVPDTVYTDCPIFYFQSLDPLATASNGVNDILTEAPDIYLFGTLLQLEGYLEHDERIPTWKQKFDDAIDQLNDVRTREEYNASTRDVRLPRVFG